MSLDDREPLQDKLKRELEESEWLTRYWQMGQSLLTLKERVPLTTLCKVEWATDTDTLSIRCPNVEIRQSLLKQVQVIQDLNMVPHSIVISLQGHPDIRVR